MEIENNICSWIGDNEGCRHPAMVGKSYCEKHYDRVYLKLLPEMADFIVQKEIESIFKNTN